MDVYVLLGLIAYEGEQTLAVEGTRAAAESKALSGYDALALEQWTLGGAKVARWVKRGSRGDWVEDVLL